jgi:hypothetical protein
MTSLLLAVVVVAAPQTVDERIQAFLKGDSAARKELLSLGASAILPLQKVRDKKPDAVEALVFDLKKAAAYPRDSAIVGRLQTKVEIALDNEPFGLPAIAGLLGAGIPTFLDPFDLETLKAKTVKLDSKGTARQYLDELCRQTGVDYGFFHNHVVIGTPERLWPAGAVKPVPELKGDALIQAKALVEKLADPSRDARLAAMKNLAKLGPAVLPVLESGMKRKDPEISRRCEALHERLRPAGVFGPPGAAKQLRTGLQDEGWKEIRGLKLDFALGGTPFSQLLEMITAMTEIPFEVEDDDRKLPVTLQAKAQAVADVLALATQGLGLDFMFAEKGIAIDAKEAIEAQVEDPQK